MKTTIGRLKLALAMVAAITVIGTVGYWMFGFTLLDAAYQTVINVTTVGFRELDDFGAAEKIFTMVIIVFGVGTALYAFTLVLQAVVEGELRQLVGRRLMDRRINQMSDHTIVCGWGRVGRAVGADLAAAGEEVVVVDANEDRVRDLPYPTVVGDATRDSTLRAAGIERARALIAALEGDAENLFVTLSGRDINPKLFIVARARADDSVPKLTHAGADRVVNPQELGAARMASFVARPHVAEFVDVVMHERSLEFRMQEVVVAAGSPLAGKSLREANLREERGVLVLALRRADGTFDTNPHPDTLIEPGQVLIAVGTDDDLNGLLSWAG
jgi:voltage-gated potassium channel